jgi:hypothetical protein
LVWCLVLTVGIQAQELSDRAIISLLTCAPGEELYAQFGHTALRVADSENDIDIVFNYGIFDFNTDHFYWKFVKGDTWYELGATPAWWFMREYEETGRPVYEQVLALTPEEQENIWQALKTNYQPQNRKYLYNFVFDNCATRPYILIAKTLGTDTIASPYKGHTGYTYRTFIRHYTGAVSWANAGINLLFGPEADRPMTSQQRLFMPEELMFYLQASRRTNGTKLVKNETIAPFETKNTPWYASWPFGLAVYFLLVCTVSIYDRRRLRWSWWLEVAVAMPYVMLLLIVAFLTFFSCHPLVGFGWRLLIIPLTHLCARIIYIVH